MKKLLATAMLALLGQAAWSQCAYDNIQFGTSSAPTVVGSPVTLTTCIYGGEYRTITGMVAGNTYRIATCGDTDFDTQITIYPTGGGAPLGYDDDFCGAQSQVTFTPTASGSYDVLVDQFNCASNTTCMTLVIELMSIGAPGPANNNCANAIALSCGSTLNGTTVGATIDIPAGITCNTTSATAPDVWYTVVGTGGMMNVNLCANGTYDSKIHVLSGTCGSFTCVAGNDDACSLQSSVSWASTQGTTYYVVVHGYNTNTGSFTIEARSDAPNQTCATAQAVTAGTYSSSTACAPSTTQPICGTTDGTEGALWYTYVGTGANVTMNTCAGTTFDSKIRVYTGSCGSFTCVTGNDDFCGLQSQVSFCGTLGVTYYVLVHGYNASEGPFTLAITETSISAPSAPVPGSGPLCSGSTATFTTGTVAGATAYAWTVGNAANSIAGTTTTGTATFGSAFSGTEQVCVTATDGCQTTAPVCQPITINALPTVTASAAPAAAVCSGDSITLSGGGASTYSWSPSVTNGQSFVPASSGSYTVTGTDANGCVNTAAISVTVNALPTVTANTSSAAVCDGDSITLSGSGASTYAWTGGAVDGQAFAPASSSTYTVTGTDANGCTDTDSVAITVNALPTISGTATPAAVCPGDSVTLTGSGAVSYTWDSNVVDGQPFAPSGSGTYTVIGIDANGCSDFATVSVTVNAAPVVIANASATAVCAGDPVTLTGSGASTYAWSGGVDDGVSFVPATSATYTVVGTDANGCTGSASVSITVNALPTASFSFPVDSACANGSAISLSGSPAGGSFSGTGITGNSFSPQLSGVGNFTITYSVTDANGCSDDATDVITVVVCVGIDDALSAQLELFPNPSTGRLSLRFPEAAEVTVFNMLGAIVWRGQHSGLQGNFTTIDLHQQPAGTYMVKVRTESGIAGKQVQIQR